MNESNFGVKDGGVVAHHRCLSVFTTIIGVQHF